MIIWTALPNGITDDGTKLKLTIFVSPRVAALAGTPFADWPAALATASFRIELSDCTNAGAPVPCPPPLPPALDLTAGDSALWKAVFGGATVGPDPRPRDREAKLQSFRVRSIGTTLQGYYSKRAADPRTTFDEQNRRPGEETLRK
ncbi:MAG TPA: hypothetical protein VG323_07575, partial [Thermoanaerobaculia bacterium]|nr:hypothetical protein [Thermoanaerobaculia bacterium]